MEHILEEIPVSLAAHPTSNCLAVGCVDGTVQLLSIVVKTGEIESSDAKPCSKKFKLSNVQHFSKASALKIRWSKKHRAPIRKVLFSPDGSLLYSVTRNCTITLLDTETGQKLRVVREISSQKARPYCASTLGEHQLIVGDELGSLSVFDWRSEAIPPLSAHMVNDGGEESSSSGEGDALRYITDVMAANQSTSRGLILATCGDGTLLAADARKKKFVGRSEPMHDELLCLTIMKNNKKVLCGSVDGHLDVFNWGEWGNLVERINTGHKDTVDCLCPLNDDLLVTGSSDGTVKLHSILPNRSLTTIGGKFDGASIEGLALCQNLLVSCDQDNVVKLYNASKLIEMAPQTKSGSEMKKLVNKSKNGPKSEFFTDLIEKEDTDSDNSDEETSDFEEDSADS